MGPLRQQVIEAAPVLIDCPVAVIILIGLLHVQLPVDRIKLFPLIVFMAEGFLDKMILPVASADPHRCAVISAGSRIHGQFILRPVCPASSDVVQINCPRRG